MNQIESLISQIQNIGPDTKLSVYNFPSLEKAKQACYSVVDNEEDIVVILRSGKGKIAHIHLADGAQVIFGGLFSDSQMNTVHRLMLAGGGTFRIAALPDKPTWLL
jgi:hypothetical protein